MEYAVLLHFCAGIVAGSAYRVQVVIALAFFVALESVCAGFLLGVYAGLWGVVGLVAVQVGYLIGSFGRSLLETARQQPESMRSHRSR